MTHSVCQTPPHPSTTSLHLTRSSPLDSSPQTNHPPHPPTAKHVFVHCVRYIYTHTHTHNIVCLLVQLHRIVGKRDQLLFSHTMFYWERIGRRRQRTEGANGCLQVHWPRVHTWPHTDVHEPVLLYNTIYTQTQHPVVLNLHSRRTNVSTVDNYGNISNYNKKHLFQW